MNSLARHASLSGLLAAALACGLAAGGAHAAPMPTQITYDTSGPGPLRTDRGDVVFEFVPVTNAAAMPGSTLRLGTILVHQASPGKGFTFDLATLPLTFSVKAFDGKAVDDPGATFAFNNLLSANVDEDGTVMGGLDTFYDYDDREPFRAGGLMLSLKPVQTAPLWNISADAAVVAVDVFARLDATQVPEPGVLLIFAAAASGLGWKRLRRRN